MSARTVYGFDGARLRELREWRGLSREQLAVMAGVSYQSIANYEVGRFTPAPENWRALARALRVRRSELIDDEAA